MDATGMKTQETDRHGQLRIMRRQLEEFERENDLMTVRMFAAMALLVQTLDPDGGDLCSDSSGDSVQA